VQRHVRRLVRDERQPPASPRYVLTDRGYVGEAEYDESVGLWHGAVVNTARAVLTFEAERPEALARELAATIDDYLAWCDEQGWTPEPPTDTSDRSDE
jgi:predicted HicB family RNase H-like nuclease